MHPDTVVKSLGAVFTWRRVGRDHQGFMTGSTQMFEYLDTELLTPFTCGRNDSATIATRTPHTLSAPAVEMVA